jgi:hypothetical protein
MHCSPWFYTTAEFSSQFVLGASLRMLPMLRSQDEFCRGRRRAENLMPQGEDIDWHGVTMDMACNPDVQGVIWHDVSPQMLR